MTVYEMATITIKVGSIAPAVSMIEDYLLQPGRAGRVAGCWFSELGPQNRVVILREFDDLEVLRGQRQEVFREEHPFGCRDLVEDLVMDSYAPFPGFGAIPTGERGPVYEFRSYILAVGGLAPTLQAWAEMVPRRAKLSEPVVVMYALDGRPRFTHIWSYPSFAERASIRAEALRQGVWPPSSAPRWLKTEMASEIYTPSARSPLQ